MNFVKPFLLFQIIWISSFAQKLEVTSVIKNLDSPVAFCFAPDGRFFITLKSGIIKVHDKQGKFISNFYDLSDSTYNDFERGLLGICMDPEYKTNKYVYAYYNHKGKETQSIRVVRFADENNKGKKPKLILNIPVSNSIPGNHVGGNIRFKPTENDYLYVSIGELANPANAQLLSNPFGKILRIHKDGSIPKDNPFFDEGNPFTTNDDRIWSYGHRNPFDFTFNPINNILYCSENGAATWDEVNIVMKAGNYGWPSCEGAHQNGSTSKPCNNSKFINPISTWPSPLPALTGILFYTGDKIPSLKNQLLVSDNDHGNIYALSFTNNSYSIVKSKKTLIDLTTFGGLTSLMQGPNGYLYALKGGYTDSGVISRISSK